MFDSQVEFLEKESREFCEWDRYHRLFLIVDFCNKILRIMMLIVWIFKNVFHHRQQDVLFL